MNEATVVEGTQYLTFTLGHESFAMYISKVREVLEFTTITRIPRTPEFMLGVINLRGNVVPVVDLRRKFGMEEKERTIDTCIVIVEVDFDGETAVLGALVDSVQEVLELNQDQVEPAPRMGTNLNTEFIHGMGRRDDRFVIILDIDKIFSTSELVMVKEAGEEGEAMKDDGA